MVRSYEKQGKAIPEHWWPPEILPGFDAWLGEFYTLATNRRYEGGPIPSDVIDRHLSGWPEGEAYVFRECLRRMDAAFWDALADARKQDGPGGLPEPPKDEVTP